MLASTRKIYEDKDSLRNIKWGKIIYYELDHKTASQTIANILAISNCTGIDVLRGSRNSYISTLLIPSLKKYSSTPHDLPVN